MLLESLAYSRDAVSAGEVWRIPASSLAHLSIAHLAGNLLAATLLVSLLRGLVPARRALAVLCVGSLGVGLGVHWATTLAWYGGLSGAIHALMAYGALALAQRRRWRRHGVALFVLGAAQVAFDQSRTLSWLGEPLAPQAHLWGYASGAAFALAGWVVATAVAHVVAWRVGARVPPGSTPGQVTILP
ncbi:MAG: rhombosortase [Lautropia sp.]